MKNFEFSILITTKNRLKDLKITLNQLSKLIDNDNVEFIICDDGSSDGTSNYIESKYKTIKLIKNIKSKGLIYSRNSLLNITCAKYAISLDDDAHILSQNPLEIIADFFKSNKKCAVIAFRIFWGEILPANLKNSLINSKVKGFVGCGHVWRMEAWRSIPNYPDWFIFYGEEDFAAFQLIKKGWEIHYLPEVLIHHRVSIKDRKKNKDYYLRLRRSLRSGWYLYFLFYPIKTIPKFFIYTLFVQLKLRVLKGDFLAFFSILRALMDVVYNIPRLFKNSNRLTNNEFSSYKKLEDSKLYWIPENN